MSKDFARDSKIPDIFHPASITPGLRRPRISAPTTEPWAARPSKPIASRLYSSAVIRNIDSLIFRKINSYYNQGNFPITSS